MILANALFPIVMLVVHFVRYGKTRSKINILIYFYFAIYPYVVANHSIEFYISVNNIFIIIGVVSFFMHTMITHRTKFIFNPYMLVFLFAFVCSLPNSTNSQQYISGMINFLYSATAYFYLSNKIGEKEFPVVSNIYKFNGIVLSLYGVFQLLAGYDRVVATYGNPNQFSIYLLICFVFLVMNKERKIWVVLVGLCILLTQSRAAILGMAIPYIVSFRLKPKYIVGFIGFVIIGYFGAQLTGIADRFQSITSQHQDIIERQAVFAVAYEMFKFHPFIGIGFNNYITSFVDYYKYIDLVLGRDVIATHNDYIKILSETGLIGFSILLIYLYKSYRDIKCIKDEAFRKLFKALFLSFLLFSFFHNCMESVDFWMFTSMATFMKYHPNLKSEEKIENQKKLFLSKSNTGFLNRRDAIG